MKIRILLVDDHPMIREIVTLACRRRWGLEVAGEVGDGHAALEAYDRLLPDVVVLDLIMPGLDGIEVARQLRQRTPPANILILSGRDDKQSVFDSIRVGARGYLTKGAALDEIGAAIETVGRGGWVFSAQQERAALATLGEVARKARGSAHVLVALTPREREILHLLVQGLSTRQMATRLGLSERTIESHISNIYGKMQVQSRVQVLHRAAGLGYVEIDSLPG
jgi:DNA-binding NarL/FixJ family response regulator